LRQYGLPNLVSKRAMGDSRQLRDLDRFSRAAHFIEEFTDQATGTILARGGVVAASIERYGRCQGEQFTCG
jgi:hypothetical protein